MLHAQSIRGRVTRFHATILMVILSVSALVAPVEAQYTTAAGTPTFTEAFPVEMGFTNLSNGNLHIEIPIGSFPQRGSLPYDARLVYDSAIWKILGTTWQPTNIPNSMGGWRLITGGEPGGPISYYTFSNPCDTPPPIQSRTQYSTFTWTAPDGTTHRFPIVTMKDLTICNEGVSAGSAMADDSSGYFMSVTNYTSATVYAPDGTEVYPTVMDTNGNYFSKDSNGNIIDTIQRTPITVTMNGNTITYAILNAQGTRTNVIVTTTPVSANTTFGESGVTECQTSCTVTAIRSIAFDDGTSYQFTYDSGTSTGHFAELTGMTLRTGAAITYGYTTFVDDLGNSSRWLSSKAVGGNTWSFTPFAQSQTAQQVIVGLPTVPTGDKIIYSFYLNNGAWKSGATYVDATKGTLLYVTDSWDTSQSCPYSGCTGSAYVRKLTESTQFPSGPTKTVTYSYNSIQTGQVSEIDESDFSTGTPSILRKTFYTYASLTNTVSKPYQVTVKDGSGVMYSQATYTYDEPSYLTATSGFTRGTPASSPGNATTVSRWVSSTVSPLISHTNFYDTGVPFQAIDPNTSSTQYGYMCQGAYPSSIAAGGLTTTQSWDCNTGLLISATDPNNQMATYHYDSESRVKETDFPDSGQETINYNLSGSGSNIVVNTKIDSSKVFTTTSLLDGLGRTYQFQVNSDAVAPDYVDTTYDQIGRIHSVSNSYRATNDSIYGLTFYAYDVLGRTAQITRPDAQTVTYSYTSRATSVQDEGNGSNPVQKIYQNDGLGRLTSVCEVSGTILSGLTPTPGACSQDIAATGFLTTYQYDPLGNLTQVAQGGLNPRGMTYDGLSRLVAETIPEVQNSTTTYNYNSVGDLYQRIRPTVNQTTPTVTTTTTYTYDSLHRLTQIQYSDGTPGSNFYYDETSVSGISPQNAKGRMTHSYRATGSTCATNVLSYDPMGRVANEWQQAPYRCAAGSFDQLTYQYDAAGDVTSFTNGQGVTFTNSYDVGGSFLSLTSSLSDLQHPATLISNVQYNPLGMVTSALLGNGLTQSFTYDKRGWVESGAASTSSSQVTIPAVPGSGSITVGGSGEQSASVLTQAATHATGSVTITGAEQFFIPSDCPVPVKPTCYVYDSGTVWAKLNGTTLTVSFLKGSSVTSIATALATAINNNATFHNMFTISSSGGVVNLSSVATGTAANFTLTAGYTWDQGDFPSHSSFTTAVSVTNGQNAVYTTVYDSGTVTVTIGGSFTQSVPYGNGSSAVSVASALATALSSSGSPVTASSNGTTTISITSTAAGATTDYSVVSSSQTNDPAHFASPSFNVTPPSTALAGGANSTTQIIPANAIYSFNISNPATGLTGYSGNGSILYSNDSTNGNWAYTYDDFNRLSTAAQSGQGFSYVYDRYGNRWYQNLTAGIGPSPQYSFDANNHVLPTNGITYDAAGNVINDTAHSYSYDAENRLISVDTNGGTASYIYDAQGRRVQATTGSGTLDFLFDLRGKAITTISAADGSWQRGEIRSPLGYLATYQNSTTYFNHTDWLGTVRMRSNVSGASAEDYTSLSFGDALSTVGLSPVHFTGAERDTETSLDHFMFRQYSSTQGRWMSPDPAGLAAVNPANPQSWNRYAYVMNYPVSGVDPLGLQCTPKTCVDPHQDDDLPMLAARSNGCGEYTIEGLPAPCQIWDTFFRTGATFLNGPPGPGWSSPGQGDQDLIGANCLVNTLTTSVYKDMIWCPGGGGFFQTPPWALFQLSTRGAPFKDKLSFPSQRLTGTDTISAGPSSNYTVEDAVKFCALAMYVSGGPSQWATPNGNPSNIDLPFVDGNGKVVKTVPLNSPGGGQGAAAGGAAAYMGSYGQCVAGALNYIH
jgi:RHS repeat-associated protein